jgi:hypothetical protein
MKLLIRLFAALLLDILAHDFFIAMTPDGADKVAFGPKFATPYLFFDRRDSFKDFTGCNTFDGLHNLGWAVGGNRLHEEVHMIFISANL